MMIQDGDFNARPLAADAADRAPATDALNEPAVAAIAWTAPHEVNAAPGIDCALELLAPVNDVMPLDPAMFRPMARDIAASEAPTLAMNDPTADEPDATSASGKLITRPENDVPGETAPSEATLRTASNASTTAALTPPRAALTGRKMHACTAPDAAVSGAMATW